MTRAVLLVMCLCGTLAAQAQTTASGSTASAVFSVTVVKAAFMKGEAIALQLQLSNAGRTNLIVDGNLALGASVQPSVTDPQGSAINWPASYRAGQAGYQVLAPGNAISRIVCLNCDALDPFNAPFGITGSYTAQIDYDCPGAAAQTSYFPNAVPLTQSIAAAPVHFQIRGAGLIFRAQPTQPAFRTGEPVRFNFQLRNTTSQTVMAAYDLSLGDAVRVKVVDDNGKEVPWTGLSQAPAPMLTAVSPHSAVNDAYPITPINLFGTMVAGCDIRQPGTYTAFAVYMIPESFNVLQAYVGVLPVLVVPGPLVAAPVKFTVEAATSSATAE